MIRNVYNRFMVIARKMKIRPRWQLPVLIGLLLLVLMLGAVYRYQTAPLSVSAKFEDISVDSSEVKPLSWPSYGQSAVATKDLGVIETNGSVEVQPTASTAKLITALAIMRQKPFNAGDKGETIKFTSADVKLYNDYVAGNGSVVAVSEGLEWTQYQALQAILLASANNVSDSMAIWAFGSLESYREYAQDMVRQLGMDSTTIGVDASGYDSSTTSTARDLAILALRVLEDPVLREITSMREVNLPGAGNVKNTNFLLVQDGIIGLKTGYIPEAGGVFVLAGRQTEAEQSQDIVTVVMGAPGGSSSVAQNDAYILFLSAKSNFSYQTVITKGQSVGEVSSAWSDQLTSITAGEDIGLFVWGGYSVDTAITDSNVLIDSTGQIGRIKVRHGAWSGSSPIELSSSIPYPSAWWRIFGRGFTGAISLSTLAP